MDVVGINNATATDYTESLFNNSDVMGKDEFLKLLVFQMKNQDPFQPMDNSQFLAQLAQFSSLETLNNINDSQKEEILLGQSMNNSFMTGLIGKEIEAYGNAFNFDGESGKMKFNLSRDCEECTVKIYDLEGNLINSVEIGSMSAGENSFIWQGSTSGGDSAQSGDYAFEIAATDASGLAVTAETYNNGLASGISYYEGSPYLIVNGQYVNLGDLITVNLPDDEG